MTTFAPRGRAVVGQHGAGGVFLCSRGRLRRRRAAAVRGFRAPRARRPVMAVAPFALLEADRAAVDVQKCDARNDENAQQNADYDANGGIELVGCRSRLEPGGTVIHD